MYRCLLWGAGRIFNQNINMIKYHTTTKDIDIMGVTASGIPLNTYGIPYYSIEEINTLQFDLVVVMSDDKFLQIKDVALSFGIDKNDILSYRVFALPNFNIERYLNIKRNPPTIFANNCWGGVTYNHLALEFCSPFVNMAVLDEDYLRFLEDPKQYIGKALVFKGTGIEPNLKTEFPICTCGDIELRFNHYSSYEEANACWERRKKRINWDCLFVMMYTLDKEIAQRFGQLPYEKKICFVPFEMEGESICYINYKEYREMEQLPFWDVVMKMAMGWYPFYDDLLLLQ